MSETRSGGEPEQQLEHTTDELDHELHRLEDHITDARKKAEERREEAIPGESVAGDWEDTEGTPGQGEDPAGAVDGDAAGQDRNAPG
jgi:septal ring factor EnvC (AmiA/AmiB activator)